MVFSLCFRLVSIGIAKENEWILDIVSFFGNLHISLLCNSDYDRILIYLLKDIKLIRNDF